ncbi:MAG: AMP-binding protein [Alphaproteobacteria bacterium]
MAGTGIDTRAGGPTSAALAFRALRRHPSRIAFVGDGRAITYAAALDLIGRMQAAMVAAGLRRGMRIAILGGNRAELWLAEAAAFGLGLVVVWLHPLGSLADQLDQIADAAAEALLVDMPAHRDRGEALAGGSGIGCVLALGRLDGARDLLAMADALGAAAPVDHAGPADVAMLRFTGGTTGRPKAAVRSHQMLAAMTAAFLADVDFPVAPRYLAAAPISHAAGAFVLPVLLRGGTVHLHRAFDPEQVLGAIERDHISTMLLVPTMIYRLLDTPALARTDLSALALVIYGAAPISPARLVEALERIGPVFCQLYGQSESLPITVLPKEDHRLDRPDLFAACGVPASGAEVRICDDAGNPVAPGEAGEIRVRSAATMDGYWRRPELTAEAMDGGWLRTGDVARADAEGHLFIVDRRKDMIVTGGFNVYPREIEDVLTAHPAVAAAAVVGAPDPLWGEAVTAVVVRKPGTDVGAEALVGLVRGRKGAAHAPKRVEFVDALPLSPVGKVDKQALRATLWAGRARMVG